MSILVDIICSIAYIATTLTTLVCLFIITIGTFMRISDKKVKIPSQIIVVLILSSIISLISGFIVL